MKPSLVSLFLTLLLLPALGAGEDAGGERLRPRGAHSVAGFPAATYLNVNNISTVFRNDGISDIDIQGFNSGLVFPKGSGKTAVYQSGFLWGGKIADSVRTGGSAYRTGLQGGRITAPGVAEDPDLAKNRIYRVRRDVSPYEAPADTFDNFTAEMNDEGTPPPEIRARYVLDWNEWPAADGAPYEDVDGDGLYTPTADIPGFPGADQTIWFVCNDLNPALTTNLYGSPPIGIELQVTAWAYNEPGGIGNTIFRKYLLLNKSASTIDSMYVAQFSDIDIGGSTDDFAGCDSSAAGQMGYAYNASDSDAVYAPQPPPAVGFVLLEGPTVPSPGDTARFREGRVAGRKNLPMTAFAYFTRGSVEVTDPTMGSYEGSHQWYNYFRGRVGQTGVVFTDPGGQETPFALAGDPVAATGWRDGQDLPAGDRRIALSSGPFTMAPADTQEVVIAEIAAGATAGVDHLAAVSALRVSRSQVRAAFDAMVTDVADAGTMPRDFFLGQNYPNPFNPSTSIAFGLREAGEVSLRLYDLLGREVRVLAGGFRQAGLHTVRLDAAGLASGLYVYRLTAGRSSEARKLLLLR